MCMNINFIINEDFLAFFILQKTMFNENKKIEKIKKELFHKNKESYQELLNINIFNYSEFSFNSNVKKLIEELKNTEEYQKLYNETKMYLLEIKKNWEYNKKNIYEYLKNTLRINIEIDMIVYIVHPFICEGYNLDNNKIIWGHYKGIEDPNYNIVYITHEILHSLIVYKDTDSDIECYIKHSIIEFISDYELYSMLKQESTLKEGHSFLEEYKSIIYPYWLNYIGLNENQIKERCKKDSIDYNKIIKVEENLTNMNIEEFINFCTKKYLEINKISNEKKYK